MAALTALCENSTGEFPLGGGVPPVPATLPPTPPRPRDCAVMAVNISMKDIELLLPRVMEKAPHCPEFTAIRHIRDAAIEFARRTRIWRDCDTFDVSDTSEPLAIYEGAQIFEITEAVYYEPCQTPGIDAGQPLEPVTLGWLNREHPDWQVSENAPKYITQASPNSVIVAPWARGKLRLELILLPAEDATELPDILLNTYPRQIVDGALSTLMLLPAEWADAKLAAIHAGFFADHLNRFGSSVPKGQQRAPRRRSNPQYF